MEMKIMSKTNGECTVYFDESDYDLISKYKWAVNGRPDHLYVQSTKYYGKRKYGAIRCEITLMHRLLMGMEKFSGIVDHIDGNGLNNKRENLRIVTHQQNMCNRKADKMGASGLKGVYWVKNIKKWEARISHNKKQVIGGYFLTKKEAAIKYNELATQYHGNYARLNNVHSV